MNGMNDIHSYVCVRIQTVHINLNIPIIHIVEVHSRCILTNSFILYYNHLYYNQRSLGIAHAPV